MFYMIPYFQFISFNLGPVTFYAWGIFVVLGVLFGLWFLIRKKFFEPPFGSEKNWNLIIFLLISVIIGGRLGYVIFYNLPYFLNNPAGIFKIWEGGMSSYGGFLAVAAVLYLWFRKDKDRWLKLDLLSFASLISWTIARIGCFVIHDHPGKLSDFFLAVQFPGGARHDLALYEILILLPLLIFIFIKTGFKLVSAKRRGLVFVFVLVYYGLIRFFLDFLRATDLSGSDPRYFGLTPAQYLSILLFIFGLALLGKFILTRKR